VLGWLLAAGLVPRASCALPGLATAPHTGIQCAHLSACARVTRGGRGCAGGGGGRAHLRASRCAGEFAALLSPLQQEARRHDGYVDVDGTRVAMRFNEQLPDKIDENWRNVVLDVTSVEGSGLESEAFVDRLAAWLNTHQPISFSVNGSLELGRKVWERSGVVVFTSGTLESPALSCQARPQDGECFGELPPRLQLTAHTRFPMLVPTPTAAYNACYTHEFLEARAHEALPPALGYLAPLLHGIEDRLARGFCLAILDYLSDACQGPWQGRGMRSCLYGLQRPPIGQHTLVRCTSAATEAACWPFILPFLATTARGQLEVSVAEDSPARAAIEKWLGASGIGRGSARLAVEDHASFDARSGGRGKFNVVEIPTGAGGAVLASASPAGRVEYPLAAQFVSNLLVAGHAKSVKANDDAFLNTFRKSDKWLRVAASPF
jgi:hypothetical protein